VSFTAVLNANYTLQSTVDGHFEEFALKLFYQVMSKG